MKKSITFAICILTAAAMLFAAGKKDAAAENAKEVLEFYHGYFHSAQEWAPAAVMRELYDNFAQQNANGSVTFKPVPAENWPELQANKVASGSSLDIVDYAGNALPLAGVAQGLFYNVKPYIDKNNLQKAVGINYTQNNKDGKIYTVHDQLLTFGLWYNAKVFKDAGVGNPDLWKNWDDFDSAMAKVRAYGKNKDIYAYGAGEGSTHLFTTMLALSENGRALLKKGLDEAALNSPEFAASFKKIAELDQKNGSQYSSNSANDFWADFREGKSGVFVNGVWAVGGFTYPTDSTPTTFPGKVALSSAGGGITIANGMSKAKTELALEFLKYMTSPEVQERILLEVGAHPCNTTLDAVQLASAGNAQGKLLAEAIANASAAQITVPTLAAVWGQDVAEAIKTKLKECSVAGTEIDGKFNELKKELLSIIQ